MTSPNEPPALPAAGSLAYYWGLMVSNIVTLSAVAVIALGAWLWPRNVYMYQGKLRIRLFGKWGQPPPGLSLSQTHFLCVYKRMSEKEKNDSGSCAPVCGSPPRPANIQSPEIQSPEIRPRVPKKKTARKTNAEAEGPSIGEPIPWALFQISKNWQKIMQVRAAFVAAIVLGIFFGWGIACYVFPNKDGIIEKKTATIETVSQSRDLWKEKAERYKEEYEKEIGSKNPPPVVDTAYQLPAGASLKSFINDLSDSMFFFLDEWRTGEPSGERFRHAWVTGQDREKAWLDDAAESRKYGDKMQRRFVAQFLARMVTAKEKLSSSGIECPKLDYVIQARYRITFEVQAAAEELKTIVGKIR